MCGGYLKNVIIICTTRKDLAFVSLCSSLNALRDRNLNPMDPLGSEGEAFYLHLTYFRHTLWAEAKGSISLASWVYSIIKQRIFLWLAQFPGYNIILPTNDIQYLAPPAISGIERKVRFIWHFWSIFNYLASLVNILNP